MPRLTPGRRGGTFVPVRTTGATEDETMTTETKRQHDEWSGWTWPPTCGVTTEDRKIKEADPYGGWIIEKIEDDGGMRLRSKTGTVGRVKVIGTTEMEQEIRSLKDELCHVKGLLDIICGGSSWCGFKSPEVSVNVNLWTLPECDGRNGSLMECAEKALKESGISVVGHVRADS